MVIFCRPGWSAGHTNMTIESIVGLGQNSTCRGKTQFTVDISLSTTRVSTVLVCWWQFSLDMSLFALDTATGVARNARVDFLLYIFGKTNWVRKSANLWAWIFGIPSNHINLQIFRHKKSVCLCVCVCIWKQICRMLFANAQALDFYQWTTLGLYERVHRREWVFDLWLKWVLLSFIMNSSVQQEYKTLNMRIQALLSSPRMTRWTL